MKSFIFASLVAISMASFANAEPPPPMVNPQTMTCANLNQALTANGTLCVSYPMGGMAMHVANPSQCDSQHWANFAYISSSDKEFCQLGYVCMPRPDGLN